jgi:hypothetical protein
MIKVFSDCVYMVRLCTFVSYESNFRSQMKRDYPLNLSILIRGGKENNHDSLSNGE